MRPLNRPMFRYGGPIKEGIMDGIREPKKNGGLSKQFNTGLVGDERYPKTDNREHHLAFIPAMGMAALRFLPAAYRGFKAARAYTPMSKQLGTFGRIKDIFTPKGGLKISGGKAGEGAGFRTGSFFRQNPIMTASLLPQASVGAYKVGKAGVEAVPGIAKAYIDALVPGESIFREKDGSPKTDASGVSNINKVKAAIGMPENLTYREPKIKKTGGGVELSDKEKRQKRIDRYRDIMDIKGMNKAAAYDSLIAASKAIGESGDFKGDLKSGRLINQIIQSTSKAFDKPKQTKDAIDTLILKGEIEKDIKASDPANKILNELRAGQLKKINKDLEGTDFAEAKIAASKNLSGQAAINAAASVASDDFKGNLLTKTQLTDVMEKAKGSGEISEENIIIAATTEVIKGKNLPDGDYTVGDVLVTIKDNQVVPGSIKR
jgi:hypothetical protein